MGNVFKLSREQIDLLKGHLLKLGFRFEDRDHQIFLARYPKLTVNLYKSGKLTIAGSDDLLAREVEWYLGRIGAEVVKTSAISGFEGKKRIGTDESGKGDFFGPLVIAGVFLEPDFEKVLNSIGVKDSKKIGSDKRITEISSQIRRILGNERYEIVAIGPHRYNQLFEKLQNMNSILGWAHARVIENLLQKHEDCNLAVADQFGNRYHINDALMKRGRDVELIQMHHGETDTAVAAASILARKKFIDALRKMGEKYDQEFPRGSRNVKDTAKTIIDVFGKEKLDKVAKSNFRLYDEL